MDDSLGSGRKICVITMVICLSNEREAGFHSDGGKPEVAETSPN